jgi:hypothetical protein
MNEQGPNIISFTKGMEKREQEIKDLVQKVREKVDELQAWRVIVEGWIVAAKEQGDEVSAQEYERDQDLLDRLIDQGQRHLIDGEIAIDDGWWRYWQHEARVWEQEMKRDLLQDIENELIMVDGMITVLESTENISEAQEKELLEFRSRKAELELEKSKYE